MIVSLMDFYQTLKGQSSTESKTCTLTIGPVHVQHTRLFGHCSIIFKSNYFLTNSVESAGLSEAS